MYLGMLYTFTHAAEVELSTGHGVQKISLFLGGCPIGLCFCFVIFEIFKFFLGSAISAMYKGRCRILSLGFRVRE